MTAKTKQKTQKEMVSQQPTFSLLSLVLLDVCVNIFTSATLVVFPS